MNSVIAMSEEIEQCFQACSYVGNNVIRVETHYQRVLDAATKVEEFLIESQKGGEDTNELYVQAEIEYLEKEIRRKKELLTKYSSKVSEWQRSELSQELTALMAPISTEVEPHSTPAQTPQSQSQPQFSQSQPQQLRPQQNSQQQPIDVEDLDV